jgi:methylated-DNA-[protein]-cysteine S-methyltransferase
VIGSTGRLPGYGGGVERKRALLDLEKKYATAELTLFDGSPSFN